MQTPQTPPPKRREAPSFRKEPGSKPNTGVFCASSGEPSEAPAKLLPSELPKKKRTQGSAPFSAYQQSAIQATLGDFASWMGRPQLRWTLLVDAEQQELITLDRGDGVITVQLSTLPIDYEHLLSRLVLELAKAFDQWPPEACAARYIIEKCN